MIDFNEKRENVESALSYATSGTGFMVGAMFDLTGLFQFLILVLSFIVLCVRLAHDTVRFYRYLTRQEKVRDGRDDA